MNMEKKFRVDALIEDRLGALARMKSIALPEKLSLLAPNAGLMSLSESGRLGAEGTVVVTRGLTDPSIGGAAERCGIGYELFIASRDGSSEWAVNLLLYLMEWELTANIDLFGRVMEMGAVTIERLPLRLHNAALNSVLIASPWEVMESHDGQIMLLAVTLIFEDEMRWALRYGRDHLSALLEEAGVGFVSDQRRSSVLTEPALMGRLNSLQMQGWYRRLNDSGIPDYILEEVMNRYEYDWESIVFRVDARRNGRLLITRQSSLSNPRGEISVEWSEGEPPPRLENQTLSDLPAVVNDLADLMGIVAAPPGSLEDGVWEQVEMRITKDSEAKFKVDWEFAYP
jgi:Suppressor of fused protein (SUFU)